LNEFLVGEQVAQPFLRYHFSVMAAPAKALTVVDRLKSDLAEALEPHTTATACVQECLLTLPDAPTLEQLNRLQCLDETAAYALRVYHRMKHEFLRAIYPG